MHTHPLTYYDHEQGKLVESDYWVVCSYNDGEVVDIAVDLTKLKLATEYWDYSI